jgi:hypothetical protein
MGKRQRATPRDGVTALTILDRVDTSPSRQRIGEHDPTPYRHGPDTHPPTGDITHQVDLLPRVIVRPKADPAQEEWPAERFAGVRVGRGETGIVLQHENLELCKLFEKVDVSNRLVLGVTCAVLEIMTG